MTYEIYHKEDLKSPCLKAYYKHYKNAFNHLLKECNKPLNNDYKIKLASNFIVVIRDDLQRIVATCNYCEQTSQYLIIETDNIGREIKRTIINQ